MSAPPQQQQPAAKQPRKPVANANIGGITLTSVPVKVILITIVLNMIGLFIFQFFGTGDELSCGTRTVPQVCYLAGVPWLGYVLLANTILSGISVALLWKTNE